MKVEIYIYDIDQGRRTLHATWTLDKNGHAVCDRAFEQQSMEMHGIPYEGKMCYPKDGETFLRNLPWEYVHCSLVRAVVVE